MEAPILSQRDRSVIGLSALTTSGDAASLMREARLASEAGVEPERLSEAVLLASLFAGFPRALVAFQALGEVLGELCEAPGEELAASQSERRERGRSVFRAIHGPTAEAQLDMLETLPRSFVDGLLGEAYGRVIGREVLEFKERELVAVSCLTVLELPRVLRAHLLAARRHGASRAELEASVELASNLTSRDATAALELARQV